ncbi:MAG: response regulator transcription factor [Anaerolineales bacterium]|nr:response regulator transcription factor [Anaerolineales bacterium]
MNAGNTKTVLICDNEARVRQALKALLLAREVPGEKSASPAIQVVGEACHGSDAVRMVELLQPEVVLMDASMPGISGIEAARLIKRKWPNVRIVMLTMYPDTRTEAADAGVDAFLLKGCLAETLFDAILT